MVKFKNKFSMKFMGFNTSKQCNSSSKKFLLKIIVRNCVREGVDGHLRGYIYKLGIDDTPTC